MKHILITILMGVLPFAVAFMVAGCSSKYIQIEKGDAVYIVDISETMKDQKADKITVSVNPLTGEHTLTIEAPRNETSPIVLDLFKAAYEAGRAAR